VTIRTLRRAALALALLGSLVLARPARADAYLDDWHPYQTFWGLNWEVAFPVGSLASNWTSTVGWLGGGFDLRVGVWRRLSVGVSGTWDYWSQTFNQLTLERPGLTFTGPVFRQLSVFSARVTAHWYFTQTTFQPYVGVGVGGAWFSAKQQTVNYLDDYYPGSFLVAPEVGCLWNVVPKLALYGAARWQFTTASFAGVSSALWPSVQLGVAYFY
jgi:opacity protein-like surface antigen